MGRTDILQQRADLAEARNRLRLEKRRLDEWERAIQRQCAHERKEYWPDPSGNNGGGYTCTDCGADLPKF